jgi:ectoine hydroxylase-related dioxygenase (phytanoyl-CoA dioxygenase family)
MSSFSYGATDRVSAVSEAKDEALVAIKHSGYYVLDNVLPAHVLELARTKLDAVYEMQVRELGIESLRAIGEANLARLPLAYDDWFLTLVQNETVLSVARSLIGEFIVLHLQNGILNQPKEVHHQSSWHRDLPHQEWTITRPLAISALFCIDEFSVLNGCTQVLPYSHLWPKLPPREFVERNAISVTARAGSVIVFDCMLFHKAGTNSSDLTRRGINHVYTSPLLRQQIDLPRALGRDLAGVQGLAQLLGYTCQTPESVLDWRKRRVSRPKV